MQDSSPDVASSSSNSNGAHGSAAPAQRQVLYRKYDPARARRVSQLSTLSGNGDGQTHPNSAAPPTRVLGGRPRSIGSSVPPHAHDDNAALPMADTAASKPGQGYFVLQHSDSTAQSLALRQRERERLAQTRQNSYSSSGSSNGSSSKPVTGDAYAPGHQDTHYNGHMSSDYTGQDAHPGMHTLSTVNSGSSQTSLPNDKPMNTSTRPLASAQGTSSISSVTLPRSQSAMATLQRENSASSRHSGFKQFIPPSAYAATASSTASSPGQLPTEGLPAIKPRMSVHLSSALARGLSNVNGMLEGNTAVRLPQSASTVASAVWNKLPPAVQQLKNEIAWDWDPEDHGSSQNHAPNRALSKSPPQGPRSLSTGAVELSAEQSRDWKRPTSSASHVSSNGISLAPSPFVSGPSTPNLAEQATHPTSLRLADQLRLDYNNKQIATKSSNSPVSSPIQRGKQPYRPGYQPKNGVSRDRTDEFLDLRSRRSVRGAGDSNILLHEERLFRRLEKIVDLHFPPPIMPVDPVIDVKKSGTLSSAAEKTEDGAAKSGMSLKPGDVFGRVLRGIGRANSSKTMSASALRSADQAIVKWQNDNEATHCPICGALFNVVTRKHHCRLCGRVVCFLPPNTSDSLAIAPSKPATNDGMPPAITPTRSARCSTFILYERYPSTGSSQSLLGSAPSSGYNSLLSSGNIREVDLGDFPSTQVMASLTPQERDLVEAELDSKRAREVKAGVRVCRECLNTVMKRQKKSQPKRLDPWLRLYNALAELQQDIEVALPLLSELQSVPEPTVDTVKQFNATRKTLLKSLTSYDLLAKRIRDLPATAGSPLSPPLRSNSGGFPTSVAGTLSSSQDRLQKAIYNKAMLFLGEKMAIIKGMGGLSVKLKTPVVEKSAASEQNKALLQVNAKLEKERDEKEQEEKMARLAVLYEQEALVSGYLDDASARRQFEDASALKASLNDLRAEIQNLLR